MYLAMVDEARAEEQSHLEPLLEAMRQFVEWRPAMYDARIQAPSERAMAEAARNFLAWYEGCPSPEVE